MHLVHGTRDKIIGFSVSSWSKFRGNVHQWKDIGTNEREREIAENAVERFNSQLINVADVLAEVPELIGYHHECYMRFIDKTKTERARKKNESKARAMNVSKYIFRRYILIQKTNVILLSILTLARGEGIVFGSICLSVCLFYY